MGCLKLKTEGWVFLRGGEKHPLFPRKPREKNRSRSAPAEMDDECPFLFSSEYLDSETNLVYYNYRYYSPELGRWTKRDSIEEEGGKNLYRFTSNNPIFTIDIYGLIAVNHSPKIQGIPYTYADLPSPGRASYPWTVACVCSKECGLVCTIDITLSIKLHSRFQGVRDTDILKFKYKAKTKIGSFIQIIKTSKRGAYGHEQKHLTSFVTEAKKLTTSYERVYDTIDDCNVAIPKAEKYLNTKLGDISRKEKSHKNDGSPVNGKPEEPVGGVMP